MPRAGLSTRAVIESAAKMLDQQPGKELGIAAVAEHLGVRPPSLYKHIEGATGLRRGIMLHAKAELATVLGEAAIGKAREEAVHGISIAYRQWAKTHPGQYPLTMRAPAPGDKDDEEVSATLVNVLYTILAGYRLDGDDLIDATRFLRSSLHGFVDLETTNAFQLPRNLDRSFTRLIMSITTSLNDWGRS
ncbi:TetR family transcriptional regulator [Tamaricihabitans halophyticus]|uniref:TetR family transcriptional regulator n=1 Tax=Tamaricihabitans halophyticus TaxID=1262583 RepID=A0A4R2Q3J2_9PSEU|nr:TetR-like C-terminal domain-containing protein [Tamaricihabitans halophyticus]TCP41215.1 TetR family transcriptional regulator [Tamaricihabitans halophyticus]